jgi:hypothetical protein
MDQVLFLGANATQLRALAAHALPQDRMHLDCVFSTLGGRCCIMLETIMGAASATRRLVDEYVRDPASGCYRLARCERASLPEGSGGAAMQGKASAAALCAPAAAGCRVTDMPCTPNGALLA